jgi:hypothetical protein
MMRFLLPSALAVALMTGSVKAEPYQESYSVLGAGFKSCGAWTADRRGLLASQNMQWILGFLSGVGWVHLTGQNPLDGLDAQAVWAWVDNYCKANPLRNIANAGEVFASEHPHR